MEAARLAAANLAAFGDGDTTILSSASGCAATLQEYHEILRHDGGRFSARVEDLCAFLDAAPWPDQHLTTVGSPFSACGQRHQRKREPTKGLTSVHPRNPIPPTSLEEEPFRISYQGFPNLWLGTVRRTATRRTTYRFPA
jgi:hypothetical protein